MPAATGILTVIPFQGCGKVRVPRTRHSRKKLIIRGMRISILESDRQRSSCGMTFKDSAHDHRTVRLDTRSRTPGSAFSAEDILLEILLAELQAGRNAVQNHSDEFPV